MMKTVSARNVVQHVMKMVNHGVEFIRKVTAASIAVRIKIHKNHDATRYFLNEDFNYRNRKAKILGI